jgi:Zn-dependent alcohol dehydrogenase
LLNLLSNKGKLILVGQPKSTDIYSISNPLKLFNGAGYTIKATQGGSINPSVDIPRYVKLFKDKSISKSITDTFSLINIDQAFSTLINSKVCGRILIDTTF